MDRDHHTTLHISNGTIFRVLLALGLCALFFLLRDVLLIILAAVVIASSVEPAAALAERRKVPRLVAVIALYLLIAAALIALFYFVLPPLLSDSVAALNNLSSLDLSALFHLSPAAQGAGSVSGFPGQVSYQQVIGSITGALSSLSNGFLFTASSVFGGALSFSLILVLSFYFSVQKDGIADFLRVIAPQRHERYVISLWKRSQQKIGLWMQGQIMLGIAVGAFDFLGLTLLGVPHAFVLALLAAAFEIIPVFGPILSALPGIAVAFAAGGIKLAVFAAILYIIVQQLESNFVYPLVVNKVVGLSPILVIIALLSGAKLGGVLGVILAVPILAAFMEYYADTQKGKPGSEDRRQPAPAKA